MSCVRDARVVAATRDLPGAKPFEICNCGAEVA